MFCWHLSTRIIVIQQSKTAVILCSKSEKDSFDGELEFKIKIVRLSVFVFAHQMGSHTAGESQINALIGYTKSQKQRRIQEIAFTTEIQIFGLDNDVGGVESSECVYRNIVFIMHIFRRIGG